MHLFCYACNGSSDVGSNDERLCQHCGSDFVEIQVRLTDELKQSLHVTSPRASLCFCMCSSLVAVWPLSSLPRCQLSSGVSVADAARGGSPAAGVPNAVPARHLGARAAA